MTREDARKTIDDILACFGNKPEDGTYELTQLDAKDMREAIKVLEQEPCEELEFIQPHKKVSVNLEVCTDAISRQAAKKALEDRFMELQKRHSDDRYETNFCLNTILELPSVTPKVAEPCEDCISRQTVLDGIEELKKSPWATDRRGNGSEYLIKEALEVVADLCVKQAPPVTQKQKMGRWIMPVQDDGMSDPIYYQVRCSECGFDLDPQTWHMELHQYGADKYCPNCGSYNGGNSNVNE